MEESAVTAEISSPRFHFLDSFTYDLRGHLNWWAMIVVVDYYQGRGVFIFYIFFRVTVWTAAGLSGVIF